MNTPFRRAGTCLLLALLSACGLSLPGSIDPAKADSAVQPLQAGVARGLLRVPVGAPLGGYLRPPVGGEYLPGLEGLASGETGPFLDELLDFLPTATDHDGVPLAPLPDELRTITSPYATISPPSRGYYDSLVTKAVALYDGNDYVVFVKLDTIAMLDELVQAVADDVQERTGISVHQGLVMSGTHTHDGPGGIANHSTRFFWIAADVYQAELFERLVPQVADVVVAALQNLKPAKFGYAFGQESYEHPIEGTKHLNGYRRARLDSYDLAANDALHRRIGVMRVDSAEGEPLAVIMNYAVHGIAFDVENLYFSGDVAGAAERAVEQSFDTPVTAMLVQSVGGDISPRVPGEPNTLQRIERFGRLLAPQVRAIYDGIEDLDEAPDLRVLSQRVILNRERLGYTGSEFPYPWGGIQCNVDVAVPFVDVVNTGMRAPLCLPIPLPDPADLADNGVAENGAFGPQDTRLMALQIGKALVLPQPGEPLVEYGVRLLTQANEAGYAPEDTFIWGYAQDHVGYILAPEKADWDMGGTEGTTTFWGWKQGQRFLDVNRALMEALQGRAAAPVDEFEINYTYRDLIYKRVPAPVAIPSLRAGRIVTEPAGIERFQEASFAWEGGDPVVDLPEVQLETRVGGDAWAPVLRANGETVNDLFEMHLEYRLITGAHVWTLRFEAPKDWPAGEYRFVASGRAGSEYRVESQAFSVAPSASLVLSEPVQVGEQSEVTLAYTPRPENYRLIDDIVSSQLPAPVREGSVTFSNGRESVIVDRPSIEVREERIVAVYRAKIAGELSVSAADRWGNTAP